MSVGGIDLGGTKIEARYFASDLREVARHRIETPKTYSAMVAAIATQVGWLEAQGPLDHVGLGSPGLINPDTGEMLTANLPATGHMLARDVAKAAGRDVPVINDCRAFTLSEAMHGAGQGFDTVVGLIIGTGVAGGLSIGGRLVADLNGQHGEFGHLPLPADVVARHELPLLPCGCGLSGCFETIMAGPGLVKLAQHMTGKTRTTHEIMQDPEMSEVRAVWNDVIASLVAIIARTIDPKVIVLGGGLGTFPGLPAQILSALEGKLLHGTEAPAIRVAVHGDASGALGAALFATGAAHG